MPDFACVRRWRSHAEQELRARMASSSAARIMDDAALARFLAHYERFSAHAMKELPGRADIVHRLDEAHHIVHGTLQDGMS